MTPAGIEPATFRFVAQHLNHCATAVPGYPVRAISISKLQLRQIFVCGDAWRTKFAKDQLLAGVSDAAACVKKRKDQIRRIARYIRTRVTECTEVDGGIFRTFIVTCNGFVTYYIRIKNTINTLYFLFFDYHSQFVFVDSDGSFSKQYAKTILNRITQ